MNIDKNIAAKLKREMSKRGVNYAEFAEELGIPRTTMQGYVRGSSNPRADSMEELANRLGISVAELVSEEEYPAHTGNACLDELISMLPTLHPLARPAAIDAVSMLKIAFRLSEDLYGVGHLSDDDTVSDADYTYCLHESRNLRSRPPSYGILVKRNSTSEPALSALVAPFSSDRAAVLDLIDRCAKAQLPPAKLVDEVQNFLAQ